MLHISKPRSVVGLATMTAYGLAVALLLTGCGGSQDDPVTAEQSGLRPADDEGDGGSAAGQTEDAPSDGNATEADSVSAREMDPIPAFQDPFIRESTGDEDDAFLKDPFQVPEDASPDNLMAYIKRLDLRRPAGATPELQMLDVIKSMQSRLEASEKLLAVEDLDEGLRYNAIEVKLGSLRFLGRVGGPEQTKLLRDFTETLKTDEDPRVVLLNRMATLDLMLEGLQQRRLTDPAPALAEVKALLAEENADMQTLLLAQDVANVFQNLRAFDESVEVLTLAGTKFQGSENQELAAAARQMLEGAKVVSIQQSFFAILGGDESAKQGLLEKADQLLTEENPPRATMELLLHIGRQLEFTNHLEMAQGLADKIAAAFANHEDQQLADLAAREIETINKRLSIVGQPFVIEGVTLDGEPFDWKAYRGKVVLVDFWAKWCGICMEEIPHIREIYLSYKDKDFAVVGVNLDETREEARSAVASVSMPWPSVVPQDETRQGPRGDPNAQRYGVSALPFVVLVDKEGKVVALHVRGPMLAQKLKEMLGPPAQVGADEPAPAGEDESPLTEPLDLPPGDAVDPPPAAANDPAPAAGDATEAGAGGTPPPADGARLERAPHVFLCGLFDDATETDEQPSGNADERDPGEEGADKTAAPADEINPYSPDEGLSSFELVEFLIEMKDKARVIQARPGFTEAVVEAADRLLMSDASEKFKEIAVLTKLDYLHKDARLGNEQADEFLRDFVDQLQENTREKIKAEVEFLLLERRTLDVDQLELQQIVSLLADLEEFLTDQPLIAKHLRIASGTVSAINRLQDDDEREEYFAKFGKLFAESKDRQLAAYGKKLAKQPGSSAPDVVGREIELAGATVDGIALDWSSYQGKIVLVQFWATWCPACLREMPQVATFYEEHREKGVEVLGVNMDKDLAALAEYLDKHDTPWTHLAGEHCQEIAREYGVRAFPTLMLVDREGKIAAVGHRVGDLSETLDKLLGK